MSSYDDLARARGLRPAPGFHPGPLTPLLAEGGSVEFAHEGDLIAGVTGTIGRFRTGRFEFHTVFARIAGVAAVRAAADLRSRRGRITDDTHYGFEVRSSRLWTESEKLNERFKVSRQPVSGRQLAAPAVRRRRSSTGSARARRATSPSSSPTARCCARSRKTIRASRALEALWDAAATVARRIREESQRVGAMQINRTGYFLLAFFGSAG